MEPRVEAMLTVIETCTVDKATVITPAQTTTHRRRATTDSSRTPVQAPSIRTPATDRRTTARLGNEVLAMSIEYDGFYDMWIMVNNNQKKSFVHTLSFLGCFFGLDGMARAAALMLVMIQGSVA